MLIVCSNSLQVLLQETQGPKSNFLGSVQEMPPMIPGDFLNALGLSQFLGSKAVFTYCSWLTCRANGPWPDLAHCYHDLYLAHFAPRRINLEAFLHISCSCSCLLNLIWILIWTLVRGSAMSIFLSTSSTSRKVPALELSRSTCY